MTRVRFFASGLVFCALLGGASAARAQSATVNGFAINRFEPSERGGRFFTIDSVDQQGMFHPAVGLTYDFAWHQMMLHNESNRAKYVVGSQMAVHLGASFMFAERFRASLTAPIYLFQGGNTITRYDGIYQAASGAGFGDIRLGVDGRVYGDPDGPFRLGLGFRFWIPSGKADKYTGDGKIRLSPRLDLAGDAGMFTYAASVGFTYRALREVYGTTAVGNQIPFGAAVGLKLAQDVVLLGVEMQGAADLDTAEVHYKAPLSAYGLLSARFTIAGDYHLGIAAGPGLSHAAGVAHRTMLAFDWSPAPEKTVRDTDGDGIIDGIDACLDVAGVPNDDPKLDGCPLADRDQDGVPDNLDGCPDVTGIKTNDPKTNGCPDRDGDKVVEPEDACPDVPGVQTSVASTNGCPADRDGDKVPDADDACPDVAGVQTAVASTNGCPPDRDGDKVPDADDGCPDHPGAKNADPKKNGCPVVRVHEGQIRILEQVKFKTGSHEILAESDGIIDDVARTLKAHPEIKKVRIEGHTDNLGNAAANKGLSARRAVSVLTALAKRGIERKRLEAKGWGQEHALDTNDTEAGRANNRRVEFHIVDENKAPPPAKAPPAKAPPAKAPPAKAPPAKAPPKKK